MMAPDKASKEAGKDVTAGDLVTRRVQADSGRQCRAAGAESIHGRAVARKIVRQVGWIGVRPAMTCAGQHVVHRNRMGAIGMIHASDQCKAMSHLRSSWNMLTQQCAGNAGSDRMKRPSHFFGRIRFQIPNVLVRRRTEHEENDARLRLAEVPSASFGHGICAKQLRQQQTN